MSNAALAKPTSAPATIGVAVHELKSQLSSVLAKVQTGVEAVITSHRKPIAKIVPIEPPTPAPKHGWDGTEDIWKYDENGWRDITKLPVIPGVRWNARCPTINKNFTPIKLMGEGPSVSEIVIAQRNQFPHLDIPLNAPLNAAKG